MKKLHLFVLCAVFLLAACLTGVLVSCQDGQTETSSATGTGTPTEPQASASATDTEPETGACYHSRNGHRDRYDTRDRYRNRNRDRNGGN